MSAAWERPVEDKTLEFIRHADKVSSKLTPEDVSEDEIEKMRAKVKATNPDIDDSDEESLRNLVLLEKDSAVFGPEIDGKKEKSSITFAGILRTQQEAKEFAKKMEHSDEEAVIIIGPGSPKDRCQETEWIYEQELKKAHGVASDGVYNAHSEENGIPSQKELDEGDYARVAFVNNKNIEGIEAEKVGPWGPEYLSQMKDLVNESVEDKETPAIKVWVALKNEVDTLRKEFVDQGIIDEDKLTEIDPALFKTKENTPEMVARDVIKYFKQVLETCLEKYPDREVHFISASHNMILDVASLRLLGHKISRENLKELKLPNNKDYEASFPLESRSIKFIKGTLLFHFRGKEKKFTTRDLEKLTKDGGTLDQEAEERLKEWQS